MSNPQYYQPYGYYYGNEADQYTFYRLPKALFTNPRFKQLSDGAKILYGLMLDRMGLSVKNSWLDDNDRVYIIFTLENVQEFMNCQHGKAVKLLSELDTDKGVGLIERVKQGQGKPAIIYVRKFFDPASPVNVNSPNNSAEVLTSEKRKSKDTDNEKCRLPKNRSQDFRYSAGNKNDLSNNDFNDIDSNDTHSIPFPPQTPPMQTHEQIPIQNQNPEKNGTETAYSEKTIGKKAKSEPTKDINTFDIYREIIHDNIEYQYLQDNYKYDRDRIDEIVDLMLETVCTSRKTIRIASDDYPAELVKAKFLKLTINHIEFVLDCLKNNTTEIRNIKKYLLAVLFNAPSTMDSYYTSLVAHDMASGKLYGGRNGGGS